MVKSDETDAWKMPSQKRADLRQRPGEVKPSCEWRKPEGKRAQPVKRTEKLRERDSLGNRMHYRSATSRNWKKAHHNWEGTSFGIFFRGNSSRGLG